MGDEFPLAALAKSGDRWAVGFAVLYKLGGWFIFCIAAVLALWIVWTSREATLAQRESTTGEYIRELRQSRDDERAEKKAAYEIIAQNSAALHQLAKSQEEFNRTQQDLTLEIRRRNDRNDRGLP